MKVQAKHEFLVIPVRLSKKLVERIDLAASLLGYGSRSRLIREAVEHYVDDVLGARLIEVRDVSVEEAIKLIDGYLSSNPGVHYVSEIAEALGIEFKTAFKAVDRLVKRGAVEVKTE